jgi:hypothetical protein
LQAACSAPKLSNLPDLQKSSQVSDEGGDWNKKHLSTFSFTTFGHRLSIPPAVIKESKRKAPTRFEETRGYSSNLACLHHSRNLAYELGH